MWFYKSVKKNTCAFFKSLCVHTVLFVNLQSSMHLAPGALPQLTPMAVTVCPADGTRALSEEAPGVGLSVWASAEAVVP